MLANPAKMPAGMTTMRLPYNDNTLRLLRLLKAVGARMEIKL